MRRAEPGRSLAQLAVEDEDGQERIALHVEAQDRRPRPGGAGAGRPSRCRSSSRATRPLATISFSRVPVSASASAFSRWPGAENVRRQIPSTDKPPRRRPPGEVTPITDLSSFWLRGLAWTNVDKTYRVRRARMQDRGPERRRSQGGLYRRPPGRAALERPREAGRAAHEEWLRKPGREAPADGPPPRARESPGSARRHSQVEDQPLAGRRAHRAEPADDRPRRPVARHGQDGLAHRALRDHVHAPERVHQRRVHLLHPGDPGARSSSGASSAAGAATSWPFRTSAPG